MFFGYLIVIGGKFGWDGDVVSYGCSQLFVYDVIIQIVFELLYCVVIEVQCFLQGVEIIVFGCWIVESFEIGSCVDQCIIGCYEFYFVGFG